MREVTAQTLRTIAATLAAYGVLPATGKREHAPFSLYYTSAATVPLARVMLNGCEHDLLLCPARGRLYPAVRAVPTVAGTVTALVHLDGFRSIPESLQCNSLA